TSIAGARRVTIRAADEWDSFAYRRLQTRHTTDDIATGGCEQQSARARQSGRGTASILHRTGFHHVLIAKAGEWRISPSSYAGQSDTSGAFHIGRQSSRNRGNAARPRKRRTGDL